MYKNINKDILHKYAKKRLRAEITSADRRREIFKLFPEIAQTDEEIKKLGLKLSKYVIENSGKKQNEDFIKEIKLRIKELTVQKHKLLIANGYPENYLEPVYECILCNDQGYILEDTGTKWCQCYRQNIISELYKNSNIDIGSDHTFENFDLNYYPDYVNEERYGISISPREYMSKLVDKCKYFVENYDNDNVKNILFRGSVGVGKTYLCECIANELLSRGVPVLYLSATSLFNVINKERMKLFNQDNNNDSNYDNIMNVDVLIIDDLGTETTTPSRYAEMLELLNTREANNRVSPCKTIFSTNLSIEEIYEKYSERIGSRIVGTFNIYRLIGDDIRIIKK